MKKRSGRRHVHVVINPSAGREERILGPLNDAFTEAGVTWSVSVTNGDGDGAEQAREAVAAKSDVVAAYGGDGTVAEVASALVDGEVPLAILPGGTGNAAAQELGIPLELVEAAALAASPDAARGRADVLRVGERVGLLRVGIGLDAGTMSRATRELKDQIGWLAYPYAALVELRDPERARVRLELDDETLETDAYAIVVANVGRMGRAGARFPGAVDPFDGLADVFLLRHVEIGALAEVTARILPFTAHEDETAHERAEDDPLWHLRARRVRVETPTGPLPFHVDGDPRGRTPVAIEVAAQALPIVLPPARPATA